MSTTVTIASLSRLLDSKLDDFLQRKILPALQKWIQPIIKPIQEENRELKVQLANLKKEMSETRMDFEEELDRRQAEADDEARRNNIVFHGLSQSTSEDALSTVVNHLSTVITDSQMQPVSAVRFGNNTTVAQLSLIHI